MRKIFSGDHWDRIAIFFTAAGIMVMRFLLGSGGVCHAESGAFLQIYTEPGKSLLQIIFDPLYTDWDCYQARELSYLLDWCDVQIIKASILAGHAHFFSVVTALLNIATAMVLHYGFRRWMPKLGRWGAALLTLLFITAPCAAGCGYFRSSKPAVALGIAIAGIATWSIFLRRQETVSRQRGAWVALSLSLLLMPYCDRQGMFFVSAFTLGCGSFLLFLSLRKASDFFGVTDTDRRRLRTMMIIAAGSLVLATFYDLVLGPGLIYHLNGYHPSFQYQNMGRLGSVASVFSFHLGLTFLLDNVGFTISGWDGSGTIMLGMFAVDLWLLLCFYYAKAKHRGGWLLLIALAGGSGAIIVCGNIMISRHAVMLQPDVIHSGYFLPSLTALILLSAISLQVMGDEIPRHWRIVISISAALIIGNHLFLEATAKREAVGHMDFYIAQSPELIRCLNDPARDPEKALLPYSFLRLVLHFRALKK